MDNFEEMDKFRNVQSPKTEPGRNNEQTIRSTEIETVI